MVQCYYFKSHEIRIQKLNQSGFVHVRQGDVVDVAKKISLKFSWKKRPLEVVNRHLKDGGSFWVINTPWQSEGDHSQCQLKPQEIAGLTKGLLTIGFP